MESDEYVEGMIKFNLTPEYLNRAIEDLASDQVDTEIIVGKLQAQVRINMMLSAGGIIGVLLAFKLMTNLIKGMSALGQNMYVIQQAMGMVPTGPEKADANATVEKSEPTESNIVDLHTFDPGPQSGPETAEDLPPVFDTEEPF